MDRKGNFRQKYCLLLRRFYAAIWKKEVSCEVILCCNYVSFGCSNWAIIILPFVWHLLFFQISNLRSIIKIQLCHRHYKLMWNFPDVFIDVTWIFPFIWLAAHTTLLFFALYTSALYILQGVLCDRERSLSCYFLPWCRIWEEGWKSKTKI
jgi:hypothetical protein